MIRILNKVFDSLEFKYSKMIVSLNKDSGQSGDENELHELHEFSLLEKSIFYYFCDFKLVHSNNVVTLRDKIIESQKKMYDLIMNDEKYNLLKKNSIYLIAIEVNEENEADIKKLVLELEEDKYYFRKLIITYRKNQLEELYEKVKNIEDVLLFANQTIRNIDIFEKFKVNNQYDYYDLLVKLMIKIPILNFQIEKGKDIQNLESIILEGIKEKEELTLLRERIIVFNGNEDEKKIDEFIGLLLIEEEEINE